MPKDEQRHSISTTVSSELMDEIETKRVILMEQEDTLPSRSEVVRRALRLFCELENTNDSEL